MEKEGIFVAFEGIDGCGKTTQVKKFVNYLFEKNKHNHIVFTRNPYKDTNIRAILRKDDDPLAQAEKIAELFIEDRKKHSEEVIIPSLKKGHHVVTDRYKLSTIAYQAAQGIPANQLIEKHQGLPIPNITFIIDVPAEIAGQRMKQESQRTEQKFEKDLTFLEKVRQNYLKSKDILLNENIIIIDGTRDKDTVFQQIKDNFEREFSDY